MAVETLAVLAGRRAHEADEGAAHGFEAAEPAVRADGVEVVGRLPEPGPRGLDARRGHEAGGRHADLARDPAREVARAHGDATGERLHLEVGVRVLEDVR